MRRRNWVRQPCKNWPSAIIAVTEVVSPTPPILAGIGTPAWHCRRIWRYRPTPLESFLGNTEVSVRLFVARQVPAPSSPNENVPPRPVFATRKRSRMWTRIVRLAEPFKMKARFVHGSRRDIWRCARRSGRRRLRQLNLLQPRLHQIVRPEQIQQECHSQGRHDVPKPIPDSVQEESQDQDYRRCQQHARPFRCAGARLVHTSESSTGEMGAATTSFHRANALTSSNAAALPVSATTRPALSGSTTKRTAAVMIWRHPGARWPPMVHW